MPIILPPLLLASELVEGGTSVGLSSTSDVVVILDREVDRPDVPAGAVTVDIDIEPPDKISVVTTVRNLVGCPVCSVVSVVSGVSGIGDESGASVVSVVVSAVSVVSGSEVIAGLGWMVVVLSLSAVGKVGGDVVVAVSSPPNASPGVNGFVSRASRSSSFHRICIAGPTVQSTLLPLVAPATVYPQTPPRKSVVSDVQV